nr:hypothetical protein [Tanacetum cinerariifolium]
ELAEYINTSSWNRPAICYNDDDEDCTIAITHILSTVEPEDSLRMGDEQLDTIPEKESEEFIKSSVENLIPNPNEFIKSSVEDLILIPSESEDTSRSDSKCILPSCDYFSPIDVPEEKSVTFSNPLFNSNDDFTS